MAIQFPLYEKLKSLLSEANVQSDSANILLASAVSKMVASTATYPHEVCSSPFFYVLSFVTIFFQVIRTRLQNQLVKPYKYKGICHAIKVILYEESIRGFYKGISTNLLRTVPSSAITILTYELIIRKLDNLKEL